MIKIYNKQTARAVAVADLSAENWEEVLWIDLLDPTSEEIKAIEAMERFSLPTRNEAQEIEVSSRLYIESRVLFMTATIMVRANDPNSTTTPVTFAYRPGRLVTLRFDDPMPFKGFAVRYERSPELFQTPQKLFLGLFDEIVDRIADILEFIATTSTISPPRFSRARSGNQAYQLQRTVEANRPERRPNCERP